MANNAQKFRFKDFKSISSKTIKGLATYHFHFPTDIQKLVIPEALDGKDIVAAAKTGSGKTIAFLVPLLELMVRAKWSSEDGLFSVILSPTRELALQIFNELRKVGKLYQFRIGLITGGFHDVKFQGDRVGKMNVLVCTPGRIVQHLSERADLYTDNLKLLILDEADRILDMGFKDEVDALLEYLPRERQTLLFSATQTKQVKDLVRLKLNTPVFISAHEFEKVATPTHLKQSYITCEEMADKSRYLWQFLCANKQRKCLIFFATCKQVKFYFELVCKLRPGVHLLQLHGGMSQQRRVGVYQEFCKSTSAVLFSTDLAARGLDFPNINTVFQFDCPSDVRTYIHRVGRASRQNAEGRAVLLLYPWEVDTFVPKLTESKPPVEIQNIHIKLPPKSDIQNKINAVVAANVELHKMAQRAVKCFLKSYACFREHKDIFQSNKIDLQALSCSYGLVRIPRLPPSIVQNVNLPKKVKLKSAQVAVSDEDDEPGEFADSQEEIDDDVDIFKPKSNTDTVSSQEILIKDELETEVRPKKKQVLSKAKLAKKILNKGIQPFQRKTFDDAGEEEVNLWKPQPELQPLTPPVGLCIDKERASMKEQDVIDKKLFREMVRRKHLDKKSKLKRKAQEAKRPSKRLREEEDANSASSQSEQEDSDESAQKSDESEES